MAEITDGMVTVADGIKPRYFPKLFRLGPQFPDPGKSPQVPDQGSDAVWMPSATSGRMPILT